MEKIYSRIEEAHAKPHHDVLYDPRKHPSFNTSSILLFILLQCPSSLSLNYVFALHSSWDANFFFFFLKDSYVWKQDTKISLKETRIINNLILFIACGALMSDSDINKMCLNSDLFDTICSIQLCTCPNLNLPHNERWHKTIYVQSICVFLNSNLCAKQIRMEG